MAKDYKNLQEEIIDVCLRRGIIFPTAEIYGGASGFYEFGPIGELIRQNLISLWRYHFIKSEENIHEISGSTILPEKVFEASGHLETFNDPLTQCMKCKSMFRVDHLLENVDPSKNYDAMSLDELSEELKKSGLVCPKCKGELGDVRSFNLMFETKIGPSGGIRGFLRPETAQNIFINFRRISHSMRSKLPFGIAQVGKAYRNEISPRNFLIRLREFEQMEIEMFVDPEHMNSHPRWDEVSTMEIPILTRDAQKNGGKAIMISVEDALKQGLIPNQFFGYFMALESEFVKSLGVSEDKFWFRHLLESETAHYSKANYDLEIEFPFGIVECIGNAYRTDYDLKKHAEKSKTKLQIVTDDGRKVVPHVIEPSFGVQRLFYILLLSSYRKGDREWTWFQFPYSVAPYEVVVAPLMKKDGLKEAAYDFFWDLKDEGIDAIYDESGQIGKRYARADEIGVPFVFTVDYQSLDDETVTIRDRDTTKQYRIPMSEASDVIRELIFNVLTFEDLKNEFKEINSGKKHGSDKEPSPKNGKKTEAKKNPEGKKGKKGKKKGQSKKSKK